MNMIGIITWIGIVLCLSQSAMFSGLNLAFFSVSRLRLEADAEQGVEGASKILDLRRDAIFWGNVSVNLLLALLSESILAGIGGFIFSTARITFIGEILPQAYFSRNAIRMGTLLAPLIRFYQFLLYPFAKHCALFLDSWVGPEGPVYMRERDVEIILQKYIREEDSEIGTAEGRGALNFLDLDDRFVAKEGTAIDPKSVFGFKTRLDLPVIPEPESEADKIFIEAALKKNDRKWVIITDKSDTPQLILDAEAYIFNRFAERETIDVYHVCHRPIVVTDPEETVENILPLLHVDAEHRYDRIIDDVILFWTESTKRIITGADILGRLLQGIAQRKENILKATVGKKKSVEE